MPSVLPTAVRKTNMGCLSGFILLGLLVILASVLPVQILARSESEASEALLNAITPYDSSQFSMPVFEGFLNKPFIPLLFVLNGGMWKDQQLSGGDGRWRWQAPFPLTPGAYQLRIQAIDPTNQQNQRVDIIDFTVLSPLLANVLFDVRLDLDTDNALFHSGDTVNFRLNLVNFGSTSPGLPIHGKLDFLLLDSSGSLLSKTDEKIEITEKILILQRSFTIPTGHENTLLKYVVTFTYPFERIATASTTVQVVTTQKLIFTRFDLFKGLLFVMGGLTLFLLMMRYFTPPFATSELKKIAYRKNLLTMNLVLLIGVMMFLDGVMIAKVGQKEASAENIPEEVKVLVTVPEAYRHTDSEKDLIALLQLYNFTGAEKKDVTIKYTIADAAGKTVIEMTETAAVFTQTSLSKIFDLQGNLSDGKYHLNVHIYELSGKFLGMATTNFELSNNTPLLNFQYLSSTEVMLLYLVFGLFFLFAINVALYFIPQFLCQKTKFNTTLVKR